MRSDGQVDASRNQQQQQSGYALDNGPEYRSLTQSASDSYNIDGPLSASATSAATSPLYSNSMNRPDTLVNNYNTDNDINRYNNPKTIYNHYISALNSDQSSPTTSIEREISNIDNNNNVIEVSPAIEIDPQVVGGNDPIPVSRNGQYLAQRVEEKRRTDDNVYEDTISDGLVRTNQPARLSSTLLEDDAVMNGTASQPDQKQSDANTSTSLTTPSYGRVIPNEQGDELVNNYNSSDHNNSGGQDGKDSLLKRVYTKLMGYLAFSNLLAADRAAKESNGVDRSNFISETGAGNGRQSGDASAAINNSSVVDTKQHFSDVDTDNDKLTGDNNSTRQSGSALGQQNDKQQQQAMIKLVNGNHKTVDDDNEDSKGTPVNDQVGDDNGAELNKRPFSDSADAGRATTYYRHRQPSVDDNRIYRGQSNLILPLDDDVVVHASFKKNPTLAADDYEGRYIYAPTQHYYIGNLGSAGNDKGGGDSLFMNDDEATVAAAVSSPSDSVYRRAISSIPTVSLISSMHHLQPGDQIPSSYDQPAPVSALRDGAHAIYDSGPSYAQHKIVNAITGSPDLNNNRSQNDAYFLVMVGAFCVMAVAMVLSAGMFAYKIQQNRKSTTDTDYPTYGVVGPNNACAILNGNGTGKCGAASFVGGYFGGGSEPGSSRGSLYASKTGSAKHLPDLYGSDSGVDKSSFSAITGVVGGGNAKKGSSGAESQASLPNGLAGSAGQAAGAASFVANQDAARMYHYQHQKKQMIQTSDHRKCGAGAAGAGAAAGRHASASDLDSDDENEDGSYTVYECPGLASAHEMEIKNPLFNDDQSP